MRVFVVQVRLVGGPLDGSIVVSVRKNGERPRARIQIFRWGTALIYCPDIHNVNDAIYLYEGMVAVPGHPALN